MYLVHFLNQSGGDTKGTVLTKQQLAMQDLDVTIYCSLKNVAAGVGTQYVI